jgi:hypothetical protein
VLLAVIAFFELSGRRIELGIKLLALPLVMGVRAVLALAIGCLIAAATVNRDLARCSVESKLATGAHDLCRRRTGDVSLPD